MPILDEIRSSSTGRALLAARTAREAFESLGWQAREGAVYSQGVADVAARRVWTRGRLRAAVRVIVRCHAGARQLVFSEKPSNGDDSVPAYWIGDDDPMQRRALSAVLAPESLHRAAYRRGGLAVTAPAHLPAPPVKTVATAFRELDAEAPSIATTIQAALDCVDVIKSDLLQHDLELLAEDEAQPNVESRELLHPVVIADADLWTLDGHRRNWLRLRQPSLIIAAERWLDIVAADHLQTYVESLTQHYATAFRRKRFR